VSYDFNDSAVASLIATTHFPIEITDGAVPPKLTLICAKCQRDWPCPTITDYRIWLAATQRAQASLIEDQGRMGTQREGLPLPAAIPSPPTQPLGLSSGRNP
jgi:hypothetical protein